MPLLSLGSLSFPTPAPPLRPYSSLGPPLSQRTLLLQGPSSPSFQEGTAGKPLQKAGAAEATMLAVQARYLLAAFLPKASISCLRHSIPSICSWAESSGPRGGRVATRADSDDLLWGITEGAGPRVRGCFSPRGPLASSPVPDPCGENGKQCQRQRRKWEIPRLNVMKLEVQELVFPAPVSFVLWAPTPSYAQHHHHLARTPLHPFISRLLTPTPVGATHRSFWEAALLKSLLFQQGLQGQEAVRRCARRGGMMGAHRAAGVTCGDSASVQTPLTLACCVGAGSRGWVLEQRKSTEQ